MMPVEFRGLRKDGGGWVYGNYFQSPITNETGPAAHFSPNGATEKHHHIEANGVVFEIDRATLGLWTGEYDKNKVKIYDGDIFNNGETTWRVWWDDHDTRYKVTDFGGETLDLSEFDTEAHLIVGNVHQNPELLA